MDLSGFLSNSLRNNIVGSIVLLVVVVILRFILRRAVLRNVAQPELRLKWLVNIRNGLLAGLVLGLGSIWAEAILLEAAAAECAPFQEEAKSHMETLERTHGFGSPSAEPRVAVQISDPGSIRLMLRVPCSVGRQGRLEQAILRRFLTEFHNRKDQ